MFPNSRNIVIAKIRFFSDIFIFFYSKLWKSHMAIAYSCCIQELLDRLVGEQQ